MQTARAGGPRAQGVYLAGAPPALRVLVAHALSVRVCRGPPRHRGPPRRRALPRHRPPPRRRALPRHRGLPRRRLPRGIGETLPVLGRAAVPSANRLSRDKREPARGSPAVPQYLHGGGAVSSLQFSPTHHPPAGRFWGQPAAGQFCFACVIAVVCAVVPRGEIRQFG
jgi:hypothetical protein